ncbi:hypothetical protein DFH06DRAFT_591229 [Mycena polygramma]|nr:hypothetical protein DFH06DRAFT_591229 [Mycena polygramma]
MPPAPVSADGHLLPVLRNSDNGLEPQRSADDISLNTTVTATAQEKANDPQSSTEGSLAADAHALLSEPWAKLKASLAIIIGAVVLQAVPWIAFAVIYSKGTIPLPFYPVAVGTHVSTYVGSTITGALASLLSFIFSKAVLQYISVRMHDKGMSLANFVSSGQIASCSFIRDPTNLKLSTLSLAVFLLAHQVAPSWNGLLLPQFFTGDTHSVTGRELDLGSLLLTNLSGDAIDFCAFNTSDLPSLTVGQTGGGFAAMNEDWGLPVSLTLMDFAFNTSTGGIFPVVFDEVDVSPWFNVTTTTAPWTIPWSLSPNISLHDGLSATTTMPQQGFSADSTCTFQDLKPDTTPSLVFENTTLDNGNSSSLPVISLRMSSNCAAPDALTGFNSTTVDVSDGSGSGYVLMIACRGSDEDEGYTLIFYGAGLYEFMKTMVCTFTPKITQVWVTTTYGYNGGSIRTYTHPGGATAPWELSALSAVTTIYKTMYYAQAVRTNVVGDQVNSMALVYGVSPLGATAAYLRGVTEYSGTVFRACLSARGGGLSADGVPQNMTNLVRARVETQYFGWTLTWRTFFLLLPGTFIAFATLYVVYLTWHHRPLDRKSTVLDPADTMHVVAASAAGGLTGVLDGTDEDKKVRIVVGGFDAPTGRVEPALIVAA